MKYRLFHEKKIGGLAAVLFGIVSIHEARRMYTYSHDWVTGDHAFPFLIGILLVLFGFSLIFERIKETRQVEFTSRKSLILFSSTIFSLFLYCLLILTAGYVISTFIISICLIRIIGDNRWIFSIISGGILTAVLYFIFIVLLKTPLPSGILGI